MSLARCRILNRNQIEFMKNKIEKAIEINIKVIVKF